MKDGLPTGHQSLVCRVQNCLCALSLEHVLETMRPLPIEPVSGAPASVAGVALIRGTPVPVVRVAHLLTGKESHPSRFVTVKVGARSVALAVDEVIGVRTIPTEALYDLPPLLRDARTDAIAAVGTLDAELLVVLHSARMLPEAAWSAIEAGGAST